MDMRILPETDREILMFEEIKRLMDESNTRYKRIDELERIIDQLRDIEQSSMRSKKKLDEVYDVVLSQALLISDLYRTRGV